MKKLAYFVFFRCGLFHLWRMLNRNRVIILMAHGTVAEGQGCDWTPLREQLTVERLAAYLEQLQRYYRFVSFEHAIDMLTGRRMVEPNCIAITFDDGYRNNISRAWPLLQEMGIPMTMFLATDFIDHRSPYWFDRVDFAWQRAHADTPRQTLRADFAEQRRLQKSRSQNAEEFSTFFTELAEQLESQAGDTLQSRFEEDEWSSVVSWDEVAAHGAIEFGSHTMGHVILPQASADQCRAELSGSKQKIQAVTGKPCRFFCYPDGQNNADVRRAVADTGYTAAVTTRYGLNSRGDDPFKLNRINVPADASPERLLIQVSGVLSLLRVPWGSH